MASQPFLFSIQDAVKSLQAGGTILHSLTEPSSSSVREQQQQQREEEEEEEEDRDREELVAHQAQTCGGIIAPPPPLERQKEKEEALDPAEDEDVQHVKIHEEEEEGDDGADGMSENDDDDDDDDDDGDDSSSSGTPLPPPVTRLAALKRKQNDERLAPPRCTKLPRLCTTATAAARGGRGDTHAATGESIDDIAATLTPGTLNHTCFVLLRQAGAEGMTMAGILETATAEGFYTGGYRSLETAMSKAPWAVRRPGKGGRRYLRAFLEFPTAAGDGSTRGGASVAGAGAGVVAAARGDVRFSPGVTIQGLKWIRFTASGRYETVFYYNATDRNLVRTVDTLQEAVDLYNNEARRFKRPLNVITPEHRRAAAAATAEKAKASATALAHLRIQPGLVVPGLVGIRMSPTGVRYGIKISYDGEHHHLGTVHTLQEAVDVYNEEARRRGKPLQALKAAHRRAAAAAAAAGKANATASPPPLAPSTTAAKKARMATPTKTSRGGGAGAGGRGAAGGGRGSSVPVPPPAPHYPQQHQIPRQQQQQQQQQQQPPQQQQQQQQQQQPPHHQHHQHQQHQHQQPPAQRGGGGEEGTDVCRMMDKIAALEQYTKALQSQNELLLSSAGALARQVAQG